MAGRTDIEDLTGRFSDIGARLGTDGTASWLFAPAIGIAWRNPAGPGTKSFLYQELRSRLVRRHDRLSRFPVLGSSWLGGVAGRSLRTLEVEGPGLGSSDCLLILGRTRSKVLDYQRMTATAIESPGCSTIPQEEKAREDCGQSTTSELLEVRPSDGVFVERLEAGLNLAAFGAGLRFAPEVNDVLGRWRSHRTRDVSVEEHVLEIERDIGDLANSDNWAKIRCRLPRSGRLTIELSHGDLQPANLLATKSGLKLVDFEHLGWRASGYDMSTYQHSLRWLGADLGRLKPWHAAEEYRFRILSGGTPSELPESQTAISRSGMSSKAVD